MHLTQVTPRRRYTIKLTALPVPGGIGAAQAGAWLDNDGFNASCCAGGTILHGADPCASHPRRHRPHHDD